MCHPQMIRSRQLRRHIGGHTLTYQDNREGLRTLPLNPGECEIFQSICLPPPPVPSSLGVEYAGWGGQDANRSLDDGEVINSAVKPDSSFLAIRGSRRADEAWKVDATKGVANTL